jgi:hypothetical protein
MIGDSYTFSNEIDTKEFNRLSKLYADAKKAYQCDAGGNMGAFK